MIGHRDQRPVNGQDHFTRGRQSECPGPYRRPLGGRTQFLAWTAWVVLALLGLEYLSGVFYLVAVVASGVLLHLAMGGALPTRVDADRRSLMFMGAIYVLVVALMAVAFRGFGTDHTAGLFAFFALALVIGVAGPVYFTVWVERRPLADLGLTVGDWPRVLGLAVLFGGTQFALTLWGYGLPAPEDWVPLLVMALVVGVFESIFFRGFLQQRLQRQFGDLAGILIAAVAYGAYHVGYGMGLDQIAFLTGLGVVYAVAFALARSVFVLWPLLTPLGSFYANVQAGDIPLPWASIAGFADVLIVMLVVIWLAHRHLTRTSSADAGSG
jgi:hypothetical protein